MTVYRVVRPPAHPLNISKRSEKIPPGRKSTARNQLLWKIFVAFATVRRIPLDSEHEIGHYMTDFGFPSDLSEKIDSLYYHLRV